MLGCQSRQGGANNSGADSTSRFGVYSISQGNQDSLICFSTISPHYIENTQSGFLSDTFNKYDNSFFEYLDNLFAPSLGNCKGETILSNWEMANKPQKVIWSFQLFDAQIDNGGITQFLFNYPEFSIAALEAIKELKLGRIEEDYRKVLGELSGKSDGVENLLRDVQNQELAWEERWKSFQNGYQELPSAEIVSDYYYSDLYKKKIYMAASKYMENNLDSFVKIEDE